MAEEQQDNPIEQLVELMVYAPIGLLYEYEDVLPKLVRRGKSQVQLARVLGQMAVKGRKGANDPAAVVGDVAGVAATALARLITDVGSQIGLAPDQAARSAAAAADESAAATDSQPSTTAPGPVDTVANPDTAPAPSPPEAEEAPAGAEAEHDGPDEPDDPGAAAEPLPIAGYDDLTAREIIPLLEDLSPAQRERIGEHERVGRNRKTVLAKLDRLAGAD